MSSFTIPIPSKKSIHMHNISAEHPMLCEGDDNLTKYWQGKCSKQKTDPTTRRKTQGTRSKETSGTATRTREDYRRTREDYRRTREDSSNIGDKTYKLAK
jgi:hypothetical protein